MAQNVEKGLEVADVYAVALYALAAEKAVVDEVRGELEELSRLAAGSPDFAGFLSSAAVSEDDRQQSLEKMFRGRLNDLVLNTLQVLNRHGRASLLPALRQAFVQRVEEARGQIEVTATSALELAPEQRAEVERVSGLLSGKKPLVEYLVDPQLLGGLVLRIGDVRYDHSLRWQLGALQHRLLARTTRATEE